VKHPGDPTPRSTSEVLADRNYKLVVSEQSLQIGDQIMRAVVVLHCGTETHWAAPWGRPWPVIATTWQQVEPVVETHTTYRPVP
jgi:hypothetical protein